MLMFAIASAGLALLGWAGWRTWPGRPARKVRPPLEVRVGAAVLGCLAGWVLASLSYAPDGAHRVVGLPLPVCRLVKEAGTWVDRTGPGFVLFLGLDVLLCGLLGLLAVQSLWPEPGSRRRKA